MDDIEKKILEKIKTKNNENIRNFRYRGSIEEKKNSCIEIVNLSDFMSKNRGVIQHLVETGLDKGKEHVVKEFVCYVKNDEIIFEGVMDKAEEFYFIL